MRMDPQTVKAQLAGLPGWEYRDERGGLLQRDLRFPDFVAAFGFMAQVALHAERIDHHPEWHNVYDRVSVTLTTHDAAGVTARDLELARIIDRIAKALAAH